MAKLDPYKKIMRAAKRGAGLRLTSDEVYQLSVDDAIEQAATQERANARDMWLNKEEELRKKEAPDAQPR